MVDARYLPQAGTTPERVEWVCAEHGVRFVSTIVAWHNGDPVGSPAFCDHCGAACAWRAA